MAIAGSCRVYNAGFVTDSFQFESIGPKFTAVSFNYSSEWQNLGYSYIPECEYKGRGKADGRTWVNHMCYLCLCVLTYACVVHTYLWACVGVFYICSFTVQKTVVISTQTTSCRKNILCMNLYANEPRRQRVGRQTQVSKVRHSRSWITQNGYGQSIPIMGGSTHPFHHSTNHQPTTSCMLLLQSVCLSVCNDSVNNVCVIFYIWACVCVCVFVLKLSSISFYTIC